MYYNKHKGVEYMSVGLLIAFIISWLSVAVVSYLHGYRHGKEDMMEQILENEGEKNDTIKK